MGIVSNMDTKNINAQENCEIDWGSCEFYWFQLLIEGSYHKNPIRHTRIIKTNSPCYGNNGIAYAYSTSMVNNGSVFNANFSV